MRLLTELLVLLTTLERRRHEYSGGERDTGSEDWEIGEDFSSQSRPVPPSARVRRVRQVVERSPVSSATETRSRRIRTLTPREVYPKRGAYILVIYNLRVPGTAKRLRPELESWRGHANVEAVDDDHVALIIHPGLAGRIALQELLNKKGTA
jgi:hypothetical protein